MKKYVVFDCFFVILSVIFFISKEYIHYHSLIQIIAPILIIVFALARTIIGIKIICRNNENNEINLKSKNKAGDDSAS